MPTKKKTAKRAPKRAPKTQERPAHWPETMEGQPVIGEIEGAWVVQGDEGPRHVVK